MPDHTYGVASGGDPAFIPDLTYNQLKEPTGHIIIRVIQSKSDA